MGRKKKKRSAQKKRAAKAAARASERASELKEPPAPSSEASVVTATAPVAAAAAAAPEPSTAAPAPTAVPVPSAPDVPPASSAGGLEAAEPVEDLDLDLDEADASDSYESLVAKVAGLREEPRVGGIPAGRTPSAAEVVSDEDADEVIDLDADDGAPGAVHRLIAQAGVGAPVEEEDAEEEIPVIDLDAGDAPRPRASAAGIRASAPSAATATRLVEAAAAGGSDDSEALAIPVDLGEVSTPEVRARLLAEALAHAEHKEARYRVPLGDAGRVARWKGVIASVLLVLAGAVAVAPPAWVRPEPPAQLNAAARERGVRMALLLQAQQVEAFRVQSQRLPNTLDELPGSLPGMRYTRSGNRAYQLIAYQSDGSAIVYDSADPAPSFRMLMHVWQAMGVAQ